MYETGHSFSMTANQKMIAVLLVVFVHSLQITSAGNPTIKGDFTNLPPRCETKAKEYIKNKFPDLVVNSPNSAQNKMNITNEIIMRQVYRDERKAVFMQVMRGTNFLFLFLVLLSNLFSLKAQ
uniref:Putative secreted salivary gland peptide n=1 Tax=Ixodes ricinus TaxID=34613 RepID=A0A147BHQ8_IXORI